MAEIEMKQPKTYSEQVEIIKAKGFIVYDEDVCASFLHRANYYRLSAYFLPFRKNDGTYFSGVNFKRICRIYEFDGRLRALLFRCIEEIEFYLRTQFAYFSAHKHGALGYLNKETFSKRHNQEKFLKLINECIEENERTLVVRHHKEKYAGQFPIWVIIEFFSIGMLSYFYSDLKTNEQKALAKEMYGTSATCLKSWLYCLTNLRNRCAHYSRLYYWAFSATPKMPNNVDLDNNRKLFSQILMLKFLYPGNNWNSTVLEEIKTLIGGYEDSISLKHIGFPSDWEKLLIK